MSNTWKVYMLTFITFLLGTAQFVIVGILDKVAASVGVSVSAAGQLITVFALANAIGTPVVMVATAKVDQRKRLLLALALMLLGIVGTVALAGLRLPNALARHTRGRKWRLRRYRLFLSSETGCCRT